jgi:hypothetical protein
MLKEFSPYLDRGQAKELLIRVMNGGGIHAHEKDETHGVDWLPKFIAEGREIRRRIAELAEYDHIKKRYPTNTQNLNAKVVSAVLLPLENEAIEQFYSFFKNAGIIKDGECVPIFDGLMVRDNKSNREHLTEDILVEASTYVKEITGLQLKIRIKQFTDLYELPADYESVQDNFFVIEAGDDLAAAEILRKAAGDRLVKCNSRYFYNHNGCIYSEGEKEARDGLLNLTKEVSIVVDAGGGRTAHYAKDTGRVKGATQRILSDQSIRDDCFVDKLWESNRGFLAYTNGVYSFKEGRLLTFEEARKRGIRFTLDTRRAYTADVAATDRNDLILRVIDGFLPDEDQRKMCLSALSRALAGHIEDKRWFVMMGQRNCGKGILCKLLMSAFGDFVQGTNAENLLVKDGGCQDAAKALSWMKDLEFKRVVFTNEMKTGKNMMDGDMVKKICSNGDWIEMRQNFKDESRIRSQTTIVIMVNDIPKVTPADAYQTMLGFKFDNEYHDKSEFDELEERGVETPTSWRPSDHYIDEFIRQPGIIDAFTALILEAYTPHKQVPPQRVKDDTNSIKGQASLSVEERFAEVIIKGEEQDVLFYAEIQSALRDCGLGQLSSGKIDTLVKQIYDIQPSKPSKKCEQGVNKQGRGFKGLQVNCEYYNELLACKSKPLPTPTVGPLA